MSKTTLHLTLALLTLALFAMGCSSDDATSPRSSADLRGGGSDEVGMVRISADPDLLPLHDLIPELILEAEQLAGADKAGGSRVVPLPTGRLVTEHVAYAVEAINYPGMQVETEFLNDGDTFYGFYVDRFVDESLPHCDGPSGHLYFYTDRPVAEPVDPVQVDPFVSAVLDSEFRVLNTLQYPDGLINRLYLDENSMMPGIIYVYGFDYPIATSPAAQKVYHRFRIGKIRICF